LLLGDIFRHTTYGPWKRALAKVDREENFHLRHGEKWMRTLSQDPKGKADLQHAVDWMFLLTIEWFGLPDALKRHKEQIGYGLKGYTNDQLRQQWMSTAVPLCEEVGLTAGAPRRRAQGVITRRSRPGLTSSETLAPRPGRSPGMTLVRSDAPANRYSPIRSAGTANASMPELISLSCALRCAGAGEYRSNNCRLSDPWVEVKGATVRVRRRTSWAVRGWT
jgi:hypothetical protein